METPVLALHIAKLELDPARRDLLVVQGVPPEEMSKANAVFQSLVPPGIRILFLPGEVKLSVLTGAEHDRVAEILSWPPEAELMADDAMLLRRIAEGHKELDEWEAASKRFINGG